MEWFHHCKQKSTFHLHPLLHKPLHFSDVYKRQGHPCRNSFTTRLIHKRKLTISLISVGKTGQDNQKETHREDPILEVRDLKISPKAEPCSFQAYRGEVLGLAGLVGAGKTEIAKCLFGITKNAGGKIWIQGEEVCIKNPQEAYEHGMAIIPEDRKLEGLCLLSSSEDNISLAPKYRKNMSRMGVLLSLIHIFRRAAAGRRAYDNALYLC